MEEYFTSDEFAASLSPLIELYQSDKNTCEEVIGYITGLALNHYRVLHGIKSDTYDLNKLNNFVKRMVSYIVTNNIKKINHSALKEKAYSEYLGDIVRETHLDISKIDDDLKKKLRDIAIIGTTRYDYAFHSFNGYFEDSIKKNGINPNAKEDSDEILKIDNIFKKYGAKMALGWSEFDHGKVSYSKDPSVNYRYAIKSPEWFAQFTGESSHYTEHKNAFIENDFEGAKSNIIGLINRYGLTEEEKKTVMDFFLKSWNKYANNNPMIAVVENPVPESDILAITKFHRGQGYYQDINMLFNILLNEGVVDMKSAHKIDTTNAKFVKLAKPNELLYKMYYFNEQKKVEEEKEKQGNVR